MHRKINSTQKNHVVSRSGISLLEVVFAVGVLLIGILGLAAVLPIAANNAQNALDRDRANQAYLNQKAKRNILGLNDLSKFKSYFKASTSESELKNSGRYPSILVTSTNNLPEVFCVDPWFLTAANTVRPSTPNSYDRALFPCYDDRYNPSASPAQPVTSGNGEWTKWPSTNSQYQRRLPRIGISDITSPKYHALLSKDQDTFSLIESEDKTKLPGIFAKRSNSGHRVRSTLSGKYSYIMTLRRNGTGNVVVFRDRRIAINPQGFFGSHVQNDPPDRHHLSPYDSFSFESSSNIPISNQTFADERIGYVTYADRVFDGTGGSFVYESSKDVDPSVDQGDWIMLLRRSYSPGPISGELQFAWCQIGSVDEDPMLINGRYRTKITVSKLAWRFHPIQSFSQYAGSGPYPPGAVPQGFNQTIYDANAWSGNSSNTGNTDFNGDPLYGTIVVFMKNIVSVRSF